MALQKTYTKHNGKEVQNAYHSVEPGSIRKFPYKNIPYLEFNVRVYPNKESKDSSVSNFEEAH